MDLEFFRAQAIKMAAIQSEYLLRPSESLTPELAVPQAVTLLQDYVRHLDQPTRAVTFARAFHPLIERWAAWAPWVDALDMVLAVAAKHSSPLDTIHLLNIRSQAARELGDDKTALQTAEQALQLAEAQQDAVGIATSLNKLGLIAFKRDDLQVARQCWERAYAQGAGLLPATELGHITMNLGLVAVAQHRFQAADDYFQVALHYYQTQHEAISIAKIQCNIADLRIRQEQLDGIEAIVLAARETLKTIGAHYDYAMVENDIGCLYLKLEDFERAHQAFQSALRMLEQVGSLVGKARVLSNLAELYVTHQKWKLAETTLKEAQRLAEICHKPLFIAAVKVDRGRMLAMRDDPAGARQLLAEALAIQEQKGAHAIAQHTRRLIEQLKDAERYAGATYQAS
ncbi:MAG TPA: tetratricopeptide repeat protein [Herpetosiphonaceae bacterium]